MSGLQPGPLPPPARRLPDPEAPPLKRSLPAGRQNHHPRRDTSWPPLTVTSSITMRRGGLRSLSDPSSSSSSSSAGRAGRGGAGSQGAVGGLAQACTWAGRQAGSAGRERRERDGTGTGMPACVLPCSPALTLCLITYTLHPHHHPTTPWSAHPPSRSRCPPQNRTRPPAPARRSHRTPGSGRGRTRTHPPPRSPPPRRLHGGQQESRARGGPDAGVCLLRELEQAARRARAGSAGGAKKGAAELVAARAASPAARAAPASSLASPSQPLTQLILGHVVAGEVDGGAALHSELGVPAVGHSRHSMGHSRLGMRTARGQACGGVPPACRRCLLVRGSRPRRRSVS